jgi:radical SAM protein with 4Fe4S-binding SPASM domain
LHGRLNEVVAALVKSCPSAQTIISTNGLLRTAKMIERVDALRAIDPEIGLAVSIDGIGSSHDRIRGFEGAFDRCVALIEGLKGEGMENLRIAFTVVDENVEDFYEVYELSRQLGIEFTCALAQESSHYFQKSGGGSNADLGALRQQLNKIATAELKSNQPKRWARAFFSRGLYEFATGEGRPLDCRAADDFFFLSPSGSVYSCNILDLPLGNLHDDTFPAIWNSRQASEAREKVSQCELGCWMVCTARSAIKQNPVRVASWVSASKIKAMLGRPVLK